ncbi:MAG: MerR family transcriptional regulator, partial [Patescibacteria group bacterium]
LILYTFMNKLITITEVADSLGYSVATLRRWDKNGSLLAFRKDKKEHRRYMISDIETFSEKLDKFKIAKHWAKNEKGFEPLPRYFCSDSFVFQSRLLRLERDLRENNRTSDFISILLSVVGQIGNNSFDHNLGNWQDIAGIFFSYDLKRRNIVLADRGQGILKTLRKAKPSLRNHEQALKTAFTEIISGRAPEHRGNGLKFVKRSIANSKMKLFFQTGDAKINLKKGVDLKVDKAKNNIVGCLANITF